MKAGRIGSLLVAVVLVAGGVAWGANTMVVTSLLVSPNATDVAVPILLSNDDQLQGIVVPLMIRSVSGGAYVNAVALSSGDRIVAGSPITDIEFLNHYDSGEAPLTSCKRFSPDDPDGPGGYDGTLLSYNGTDKQTVTGSPYGILFVNQRIFGDGLLAGSDATGSYTITVDVNDQPGTFEIDTTCVTPSNHLLYSVADQILGITPDFTKGVITIEGGAGAPPVALDDYYGARGGVTLLVTGAGVLSNDNDPDGDPMTAVLNSDVGSGDLTLNSDGSFLYTPDVAFVGTDQFTYYANDGANSNLATVNLQVRGAGPVPPGDYDEDGQLTAIDMALMIEAVLANGLDPTDGGCRAWPRGDFDCDSFSTAIDLALMIDHLFAGGPGPCDPCAL
jgi:hypothetical protein